MTLMLNERDTAIENLSSGILKRASRLSVAIHRVSDFFEPREALREQTRNGSVELLISLVSFTGSSNENPGKTIKDITDITNKLLVLYDVLINSTLVSEEIG